ncbi:Protease 3 [Halomonadaceae bacterium LMG 33818]
MLALPPMDIASPYIHKSANDPREYRYLTLQNGLKVLLVRDPTAEKSAVAMNVEAGSADEPTNKSGLAHFLEHMLFLGNDHYPEASEFSDYIHAYGGRDNAYTDFDRTNYRLEVARDGLSGALARFSRFFIAPLLSEHFIERERFAVKSEYELSFSDNSYRFYDALWQASSRKHPITQSVVGDMTTLSGSPSHLKKALKQFFKQHYSANRMQLVIMSAHTLEEMTAYAKRYFAEIPNHHLPKRAPFPPILSPDRLPARMSIESETGSHHLVFYFPIPDPTSQPQHVPYDFVRALISHQGEGTLTTRLMEKGWVSQLDVDLPVRDKQQALMYVDFQLTEEGITHIDDIRTTFFDYMELIQTHSVTSSRNAENARLAALHFSLYQPHSDMETASELSSTLSYTPASEINITTLRSHTTTAESLATFMRYLTPENMLQLYNGPNVEVAHYSPRYHVGYRWEKVQQWPQGTHITPLNLPKQNKFIPQRLTMLSVQDYRPRRLINQEGMDVWYQGDNHYHSPRVEWRIRFMNPNTHRSPHDRALTALLVQWLNQTLEKNNHPAQLALQFMNIGTDRDGIATSFSVWNDRSSQLITTFTDALINTPVTPSGFEEARAAYRQSIEGKVKPQLYNALLGELDRRLNPYRDEDKVVLAELKSLKPKELEQFRRAWLNSLHVQVLAIGNVTSESVIHTANTLHKRLKPSVPLKNIPVLEAVSLPASQIHLQPTLKGYTDSAALLYFQPPQTDLRSRALTRLIEQLIQANFYTIMRTNRQLGYVVNAEYYPVFSRAGLLMLIESSDFPSNTLNEQMLDFMALMTRQLQTLTYEQLEFARKAVVQQWFQRQDSLSELADKQTQLLELGNIGFDLPYQLYDALKTIDTKEVQSAWEELIRSPSLLITHDPEPSSEGSTVSSVEHSESA